MASLPVAGPIMMAPSSRFAQRHVSTLYSFQGSPASGADANGGMLQATNGNFYGTTTVGGTTNLGAFFLRWARRYRLSGTKLASPVPINRIEAGSGIGATKVPTISPSLLMPLALMSPIQAR
jgi:hypothetical protein